MMTKGMYTNRHTGIGGGAGCQAEHQLSVVLFATHGRTIFAIEGDVHNANAKFLVQLGLQLQAFAHARLNAAVVVANRQNAGCGLSAKKNVARVLHGVRCKPRQAACSPYSR